MECKCLCALASHYDAQTFDDEANIIYLPEGREIVICPARLLHEKGLHLTGLNFWTTVDAAVQTFSEEGEDHSRDVHSLTVCLSCLEGFGGWETDNDLV